MQWAWIFDMPAERIRDAFKTGELSEQSVESEFSMDPEGKTAFVRMALVESTCRCDSGYLRIVD